MIRDSVRNGFVGFTGTFEGILPHFYLDFHHDPDGTLNPLVTIGIGDLVDPVSEALSLPMLHRDGTPASVEEIRAEWLHIKSATALARLGGGAFAQLATLHLSPEGINALVLSRELFDDAYLERRWKGFADWPADAQLGALSCAWAAGSGWLAPRLDAAMVKPDFDLAAGPPGDANTLEWCRGEAWLRDGTPGQPKANLNPGLRPRNLANQVLFRNAAVVESMTTLYDFDTLYYPTHLSM